MNNYIISATTTTTTKFAYNFVGMCFLVSLLDFEYKPRSLLQEVEFLRMPRKIYVKITELIVLVYQVVRPTYHK